MKLKKILVPTDLSEESLRPIEGVRQLACDSSAHVHLLHVVADVPIAPHGAPLAPALHAPDLELQREQASKKLEELREKRLVGVESDSEVILGVQVAKAVADHAAGNDYDLIALSTHGRTGFRRLVLGSVAEEILRQSTVPVLVFPRKKSS